MFNVLHRKNFQGLLKGRSILKLVPSQLYFQVNKQQSNFSKLRTVSLRRCAVSNLGPNPEVIGSTLERVQVSNRHHI